MSLFAIGDLHLSFGADKPMDVFRGWSGYVERLEKNWRLAVKEEDTVVIPGDISWGITLSEALADFRFLESLPGKKILIKGNHDYWWETRKKTDAFFEEHGLHSLKILFNDAVVCDDYVICGTRGWFYDAETSADKKVLNREAGRLRMSLEAGKSTGKEPLVFLHYPPAYGNMECAEILDVLRAYRVRRCFYGHLHGPAQKLAINGTIYGISLTLVSGDHLAFDPLLIK